MTRRTADTRERILEAAADIFGKRGFKAATIRQIAEAAGANVAAVNYYFRDKAGLYGFVLEDLLSFGFTRFPADMDTAPDAAAENRLRAFIRAFCHRLLSPQGWGGYHGRARLMVKELTDPTPTLDKVIEKHLRPHKEILVGIITELLGPAAEPRQALACTMSIVGQCLYYAYAQPVIARIAPDHDATAENIEVLAEHVFRFSMGGIDMIRQSPAAMFPDPRAAKNISACKRTDKEAS